MFTGLIEETGSIQSIRTIGGGKEFVLAASAIMDDIGIDDSIAVQGVCLTVVAHTATSFTVQAIEETLAKTTIGALWQGQRVNLERAMLPTARLGGHIVQGHVDCTGSVVSVENIGTSWEIWVEFPAEYASYVVPVGSICINGISLTVARVDANRLMVAIIPHTWSVTTISELQPGSKVNLEFDIIAKYVQRMMQGYLQPQGLTAEKLRAAGWGG